MRGRAYGVRPSSAPPSNAASAATRWSAIPPLLALYFSFIVDPINLYIAPLPSVGKQVEAALANRIFWPLVALLALIQAVRNVRISGAPKLPSNIVCLLLYVGFAGLSVTWALKPDTSLTRYVQQALVLTAILLPPLTSPTPPNLLRGFATCLLLGAILNLGFLLADPPRNIEAIGGHIGYFLGKNYLGEFAAVACQIGFFGLLFRGVRRIMSLTLLVIGIALLLLANSKTSIALAGLTPLVAWAMIIAYRHWRLSPATFVVAIVAVFWIATTLTGVTTNRIGGVVYGDPTFTGRTIIWDFVGDKIDERPLLGWGYQSFWLIGPASPALTQAPGFVKNMPNGHSGYYDTILELGYVGFAMLIVALLATLHATRGMIRNDPLRAQLILALLLTVICHNLLESLWMRGYEMYWVLFLILATEVAASARRARHVAPSGTWRRSTETKRRAVMAPRMS